MNLKNLKNEVLVKNTENLIKEENRILSKVLAHFLEIEARKLYLELGYGSLFLFAVKVLGYSEASAQRRIEAMRFLKKTPEAQPMVEKGNLNLSKLSLLERLSKEAKASHGQNIQALSLLQEKQIFAAEVEDTLREHFNLQNKKRVIKIEVDEATYQLWLQAKAHLCEVKDAGALKKLCESLGKSVVTKPQTRVRQSPEGRAAGTVLRRQLLSKAGYRCEYVSLATGERCDSTHFLQCDHITPYYLGGKTVQQNMRVLCAQHNQLLFRQLATEGCT